MKAQRVFRVLWRVNAVLIAIAAAGIAFAVVSFAVSEISREARRREAAAAAVIPGKPANKELTLGGLSRIDGTTTYRATLSSMHRGGFDLGSSGGSAPDERNVLFIDIAAGTATWLLPNDNEIIAESADVTERTDLGEHKPPLAIVALVKPYRQGDEAVTGRLLIADATGHNVEPFASDVHSLHGVTVTPAGDIAVLFQKNGKYYLASFDRATRAKRSEREIAVPALR